MTKENNQVPSPIQQISSNDSSTILKQYQELVDFAHKEIESVQKINKWFFTLASIIFAIIFSAGGFFIGRSTSEIRSEANRTIKDIQDTAVKLENEVVKQVNDELSKDNIQKIIVDNVSKRVNDTADILIENKIKTIITPKLKESDIKLESIDNQLKESLKTG